MHKKEGYRKAVWGKTSCTVWWGGGGWKPTTLLYSPKSAIADFI